MEQGNFPVLILTGRPAAGKSEVIDFLKKTSPADRLGTFRIGAFEELDDFLYVWETFETDDILTRHGRPRLWTDERYWFKDEFVWDLYLERINLEYRKKIARDPAYHRTMTTLIEFARGGEHGIAHALACLHGEILSRAALVYIRVSYEESVRKNRRRARKGEEHSILYHSLPDEKMDYYYKTNDWEEIAGRDPAYIRVGEYRLPYAVFENEPEKTHDPKLIAAELRRVTEQLWGARLPGNR
jgi:hypothetical protein